MNFPPLPAGFEPVEEAEAPAAPETASEGFPPLPAGFEPVEEAAAPTRLEGRDFGLELNKRIREHKINSQEDADAFARDYGPEGVRVDVAETIAARDEGARVTNNVINDNSIELWLAHKQQQGEDVSKYLDMTTEELHGVATEEYRQQVKAAMERRGIDTESGKVVRLIGGLGRSPEQLAEGLAQLGIRGAEALGIIEETSADDAIAYDARVRDEAAIRGRMGKVGNFAGDVLITAPLPFKGVTGFTKQGLNTAATIGKRAASGAAATGLKPTDTGSQQAYNAIMGSLAAPVLAPVAERVIALGGHLVGETYMKVVNKGVGNKIFDDAGNLTTYGRMLRTRLRAVNPDLPDEFIDETLQVLKVTNPRRLPKDEAIVQDTLADSQKVPLTAGMKERDSHRIADFESAQAGQFGDKVQKQAEEISQNIDDAVRENIRSISPTGASTEDAATAAASALEKAEKAAADVRDEGYDALKDSTEALRNPAAIGASLDDFFAATGNTGIDLLAPETQGIIRLFQSASRNSELRFGQFWRMSKTLNTAARDAKGQAKEELTELKRHIDGLIMEPETLLPTNSKALTDLRRANAENKKFMDTFAARDKTTRSGKTVSDNAGRSLEKIVTHVRTAAERGEPINPAHIEKEIFGSAKGLSSATAKEAPQKIARIIKAAPETADAIKTMSVNRVLTQVEEGLFVKGLKAGKLQTVVRDIVESNKQVLKAAGWTDADITRLQMNAYLASLKALPKGAGNPSGSGKWVKVAIGTAFRRAIATIAAAGAGGAGLGMVDPIAAALVGTVWVGSKVASRRVAKRALTGKVKPRGRGEGSAKTKRTGQIGAAALVRQIESGGEDDE